MSKPLKKPEKKDATFINHKEGKVQLLRYESGWNSCYNVWEVYHKSLNLVSRELYDNKLQAIKSLRKQKKELLRRLGEE